MCIYRTPRLARSVVHLCIFILPPIHYIRPPGLSIYAICPSVRLRSGYRGIRIPVPSPSSCQSLDPLIVFHLPYPTRVSVEVTSRTLGTLALCLCHFSLRFLFCVLIDSALASRL